MLDSRHNTETKLTIVGLLVFLFLGLLAFLVLSARMTMTPIILIYLVMIAVLAIAVFGILFYMKGAGEKAKRGLEEMDTYSFIDMMLDELSTDELIYLKRLVNEAYQDEDRLVDVSIDDNPIEKTQQKG